MLYFIVFLADLYRFDNKNMYKKVNLKSIAREMGVSVSTVSKALKDSKEISEETKGKIVAYARANNYKPNTLALNLQKQKTMTIGIVVPELVHHFFSRVISGVEHLANETNYNMMISLSNDSLKREEQTVEMFSNGSVDGILVSVAKETLEKGTYNHFTSLINDGFPIVFFDRIPPKLEADKVIIDDVLGGYKAAKHLLSKGRKNLAILTTPSHITVGCDRQKGFNKAIVEAGLTAKEALNIKINEKYPIEEQIAKVFEQSVKPDGIFAVNENYAAIALRLAHKKNIAVPKDLSIIGFTDGLISKHTQPSMTTVAQHGFEMGVKAMELLLNRIEEKEKKEKSMFFQTAVIQTNIVQRAST